MAFKYFRENGKGGVIDLERSIVFQFVVSRPEAPDEFVLKTAAYEIKVFMRDRTKNIPGEKLKVVWSVDQVCLHEDLLDQKDEIRAILLESLIHYTAYYKPETIASIQPSFEDTIWR